MTTPHPEQHWFEETLARNNHVIAGSAPAWLEAIRTQARQSLQQLPIPNRKQEAWRYSRPSKLYEHNYYTQAVPVTALEEDDIEAWVYPTPDSYHLVFANGHFVPALSHPELQQKTIRMGSLREALTTDAVKIAKWFAQSAWDTPDVFTALNRALLHDGLFLYIPHDTMLAKPIEVVYLNFSVEQPVLAQTHSLVVLEKGAQATLIEHFVSTGDSDYFANGMSEILLGDKAILDHYRLQDDSRNAHHLSRVGVQQDTASDYRGINIATGGAWSRADVHVRFTGPQANCEIEGVYTVGDAQYSDVHLDVQHGQPGCRSRENFRGLIYGKGQAVFDGRILVDKDAQKSDALLTNKNLLLSEDAEVNTKPQLEIYANDVKCGHGTTVGKIDPDQIYYLRSRGINELTAQRMLCLGFAEEILSHIEDETLHAYLAARISAQFANLEKV